VVLEETQARDLICQIRRLGASGIFTYPLNLVIP
jgi:hypothetical protein